MTTHNCDSTLPLILEEQVPQEEQVAALQAEV